MDGTFEKLSEYTEKAAAIQAAMVLFEWDNETLAPKEAAPCTSKVIGSLTSQYMEIMTDDNFKLLVEKCRKKEQLTEAQKAIVKECDEEIKKLECIPAGEYRAFAELTADATCIWARAREAGDFEKFVETLEKIVDYQRKFASYRRKKGQKLYDVMLDTHEKGFNMELLDCFFDELKENIVPVLKRAARNSEGVRDDFLSADYPIKAQEEAARFIAEYVGFNFDRGVLTVSAHPFTTNIHNHDVRITTHYKKRIDSSIFSVIHETGHALYELGIRDDLTLTPIGQGTSTGMHEAQSRFFENMVGRNEAFWEPIYGEIQNIFGEPLKSIPLPEFMKAVNKVTPGCIRTDSDELSYALHVMVRYEVEKLIFEEHVPIRELPDIWNQKYEEYLGVKIDNDKDGILQDIHWSQGSFGYFPSYALGSAFSAQLYYQMKNEMDFAAMLREGKLSVIREYLRENIHQFGKMKDSRQLLKEATGEDFTPKYYIEYLKEKYR